MLSKIMVNAIIKLYRKRGEGERIILKRETLIQRRSITRLF